MKACTKCGEVKPLDQFYKNCRHKDGHAYYCKECNSRGYNRNNQLKSKYGITLNEYDRLLSYQGGGCAICGTVVSQDGRSLHVDHNHVTGAVRGILCGSCNKALGLFNDDVSVLLKAVEYLGGGSNECTEYPAEG